MKIIWCMIPEIWIDRIFSHFGPFFALLNPLLPLTTQRTKILKKWKKYRKISSVYHKWLSYDIWFLRYEVHQMECFLSSWALFCPFTPNSLKNENFTKIKKGLQISSFYTSVPKIMIIGYTFPEIWHVMDVIGIFHFGLYFSL